MTRPPALRVAVVARGVMPLHGLGGLERSVHDLVTHLGRLGLEVTLITPPPSAPAAANPFPSTTRIDVPYVTFPLANRRGTTILDRSTAYPLFGRRAGRVAADLVAKGRVDIVHGFGASVLGYARERVRRSPRGQAPLVLNPQGLEEFGATAASQPLGKRIGYTPLRAAVRACARAADAIIATDRALEPAVARHLHPRPGQMHTIPNGIDLDVADAWAPRGSGASVRARAGIANSTSVLLSAGRIEFNKGLDVLARALAPSAKSDAQRAADDWIWVVAGDGPFRSELERVIGELGLTSRVHFAGRVSDRDLHAWYDAATVFVHPTRYEGSSLVTLEAMAHRRAVVASRAGGLPDKVHPGVNGWLVEPDDPAALARAIDDALSDRVRLEAFGAAGRRIVEAEFAWPHIAAAHVALYEALRQRR